MSLFMYSTYIAIKVLHLGKKLTFLNFYAQKKKLNFGENSYTHVHTQNLFMMVFLLGNLCSQED